MNAAVTLPTSAGTWIADPAALRGVTQGAGKVVLDDVGVLAVLAAAAAYVVHRVDAVLHYRWDWSGVWVYLLRVTAALEDWPERGQRRTRWVSCAEAARLLREPLLRSLCRQLVELC